MENQIFIDHCYNIDQNYKFYKKLERAGFLLDEHKVEHPGKAFCRFISFNNKDGSFYLEFVSFGKNAPKVDKEAGLSFGYKNNLKSYFELKSKELKLSYNHKNYRWKDNSEDYLPGWNFLDFKKQPFKNIYTWFTEYEPNPTRKFNKKASKHPNGVTGLHGVVIQLTPRSRSKIELILNQKIVNNRIKLDDTFVYLTNGKTDCFKSIILKCKSFKKAAEMVGRFGGIGKFNQHSSVEIPANNIELGWNIVLIEMK